MKSSTSASRGSPPRGGASGHGISEPTARGGLSPALPRTFGFYQGLAAVAGSDGWRHIRPDGADLYPARLDWCGNFREGRCAVRELDGNYLHITPEGRPAYGARWRYAGDFHDGMAVAQSGDGRSTHIDPRGEPVHGARFLDLDVFHKGCARARDEGGWTHIDAAGRPLYARRFAMVEPFYNGQARVERFDGGLEVIDAAGCALVELRPPQRKRIRRALRRSDRLLADAGDLRRRRTGRLRGAAGHGRDRCPGLRPGPGPCAASAARPLGTASDGGGRRPMARHRARRPSEGRTPLHPRRGCP